MSRNRFRLIRPIAALGFQKPENLPRDVMPLRRLAALLDRQTHVERIVSLPDNQGRYAFTQEPFEIVVFG